MYLYVKYTEMMHNIKQIIKYAYPEYFNQGEQPTIFRGFKDFLKKTFAKHFSDKITHLDIEYFIST